MVIPKPVKKCKCCKKVLRSYNKSGICSACRNAKRLIVCPGIIEDVKLL